MGKDTEEIVGATRMLSWRGATSNLPDDSREADERAEARNLRDLRGRVKAARAAIPANPGSREILDLDWVKEAVFYARFGITEAMFRHGVLATTVPCWPIPYSFDVITNVRE